jgi:hypothetical protein
MPLEDVYILPTLHKGPAQLAVHLAKLAAQEENPVTEALVLWFDADGAPGIAWSELTPDELLQLEKYLRIVNDDIFR